MYCRNCGAAIEDRASYCSQCGTATAERVAREGFGGHRLTRSIYDSKIAGVCGGLGNYLDVDPTLVRLTWLVGTVCFPPLAAGYLAAWMVMPKEAPQLVQPLPTGVPQPQS